jgi:hypothetical protein
MIFSDEYKPVGKPIKKVGAELQPIKKVGAELQPIKKVGAELQPIKKVEACVSIFPMYNIAIHLIWIA